MLLVVDIVMLFTTLNTTRFEIEYQNNVSMSIICYYLIFPLDKNILTSRRLF